MGLFNSVLITFTFILQLRQQIVAVTVASQQHLTAQDSLIYSTEKSASPLRNTSDNSLQRNKFLIRKCCGRGQVYNFNLEDDVADRKDRCVKYSITDNLFSSPIENSKQIFFGHEQHLPSGYILENFEVDTGFPRNCMTNMLLEPHKRMADLFYPLASGQLLLPHRFWLVPFENHCIEDFFENENFTKPRRVAFICDTHVARFPPTAIDDKGKLQLNFIKSKIPSEMSSVVGRKVIRKCCDQNEIYSLDATYSLQCVENEGFVTDFFGNLQSTRSDELFFRIEPLKCFPNYSYKFFQLTSNDSLEISNDSATSNSSNHLVSIEDYCIEDVLSFDSDGLPASMTTLACLCPDNQVPELITPELITPELITPELITPELITPELTTPEYPVDSGILHESHYNQSNKMNIPKCCPSGYIMDEFDMCYPLKLPKLGEDSSSAYISKILNSFFLRDHNIVSNLIKNNVVGSCQLIHVTSLEGSIQEVKFEDGANNESLVELHYFSKNYWKFKLKSKLFCVDLALSRQEKEAAYNPNIYYCLPTSFNVSIHYPILLSISAVGLIATLIIYFFVPTSGSAKLVTSGFGAGSRRTRTPTMAAMLTGRILLCHVFTLSITFICLAMVQQGNFQRFETSCVAVGYIIYGASIASFAWLTVYCFDYYRIFSGSFKVSNEMLFIPYSVFGWGVPILAVIAATITQFRSTDLGISDTVNPNMGLLNCWFPDGPGISALIFFYAPVGTLLLVDVICFLSLIFNPNLMQCWKRKNGLTIRSNRKVSKEQQDFKMVLKLLFITGIPWVFEIAAWLPVYLSDTPVLFQSNSIDRYVLEIGNLLNSLRGVIIFIIFIVLQRDVRHYLTLRIKRLFNRDSSSNVALQHSGGNTDGGPSVSTQPSNNRQTSMMTSQTSNTSEEQSANESQAEFVEVSIS